jgi:hypothetical protein
MLYLKGKPTLYSDEVCARICASNSAPLSAVFATNPGNYPSISSDQPGHIFSHQLSDFINIFCSGYPMEKNFRY